MNSGHYCLSVIHDAEERSRDRRMRNEEYYKRVEKAAWSALDWMASGRGKDSFYYICVMCAVEYRVLSADVAFVIAEIQD